MEPPKWKYKTVYDITSSEVDWFFHRDLNDVANLQGTYKLDDIAKGHWDGLWGPNLALKEVGKEEKKKYQGEYLKTTEL